MARHPDRGPGASYDRKLGVLVERERARFGAWYELFPRSTGEAGRHGTFRDVERRLPYVAGMGFDVLYLPPTHPVSRSFPKGPNITPHPSPLDFECADWQALWEELLGVVLFWCGHGVRIFRVDNPHTKPFRFWHWLIAGVRQRHPDALFLSEAFTRPKVMKYLAKAGFSQS